MIQLQWFQRAVIIDNQTIDLYLSKFWEPRLFFSLTVPLLCVCVCVCVCVWQGGELPFNKKEFSQLLLMWVSFI